MFLDRKIYIGAMFDFNEVKGEINITRKGIKIPIDLKKVNEITEEVCYWRKANQIHNWFVENVQNGEDDCQNYYVSIEQLEELYNLCKIVIEKAILQKGKIKWGEKVVNGKLIPIYKEGLVIINANEIKELLPTQKGFFFGGTDYDEWYLEDIKYTMEMLGKILQEDKILKKENVIYHYEYRSSW